MTMFSGVSILKVDNIPDESKWESGRRYGAIRNLLRDATDVVGGFGKTVEGANVAVVKLPIHSLCADPSANVISG